jgi:hypothetical protein
MKWSRPVLIFQMHVGAAGQQCSHGLRRTGSHGSMERRHAAAIEGVRIGSGEQEVRDRVALCRRLPSICVGGIVQRLGTPPISGTTARSTSYQSLGDRTLKGSGSHMERCVSRHEVVANLFEEKLGRLRSRRACSRRRGCQLRMSR